MIRIKKYTYLFLSAIASILFLLLNYNQAIAAGSVTFLLSNTDVAVNKRANITISVTTSGENIQSGDIKLNFPPNVKFESYTPRFTPFDAYNAEIFNKPSGSESIVLTFISNGPVSEGIIGTIQVSGISEGLGQITLSEVSANDATESAGTMTVSVVNSLVTVVPESVAQQTNPIIQTPVSTTAIVPMTTSFNEGPSETPQPTNSVAQNPNQDNVVNLDNVADITTENLTTSQNSLLDTKTADNSNQFYGWVIVITLMLSFIVSIFLFIKKKRAIL